MTEPITIKKLNLAHEVTWSYSGHVTERTPSHIKLEARFNRDTSDAGYVVFERNDRFVETFFADRWYNIFEIHSAQDDHLKGWYCNIVKPATFHAGAIEQIDLALDVWINPDGSSLILDEDEFAALELDAETRRQAREAVIEVLALVRQRAAPFNSIT
jgi:predicted RNA-binding protein associated with RNAse of E/G family